MTDLDKIYEQYARDVFRYLMCLCQNPDLSEELTQETFYQAVKSIDNYNGSCKITVWLCQIAKHSYYKYLRKNKHYRLENLEDIAVKTLSSDNPEEAVAAQSALVSIYRNIHNLDKPYKEVMLLRLLGELSFREIGEVMGKSENWARVTFYRSKLKLRERIDRVEY